MIIDRNLDHHLKVSGAAAYETEFRKLWDGLEIHPVYENPYFRFLQSSKWTRETYALHRANFFYRTELTVKTIAHVCARSAEQEDQGTLILFSYVLNEECGAGNPQECHAVLMETAHNIFGQVVFDLEPMWVSESKSSPLIIESTERYRQRLMELCGGSYQRMLGVAMALETHAEKMLRHCRTAFRTYADRFEMSQFVDQVEVYFNAHLEGVEQRHADDARACASRNCASREDFGEIAYGAREALGAQLAMWTELYDRAIEIGGGHEV